jgi:hypothetical protein
MREGIVLYVVAASGAVKIGWVITVLGILFLIVGLIGGAAKVIKEAVATKGLGPAAIPGFGPS